MKKRTNFSYNFDFSLRWFHPHIKTQGKSMELFKEVVYYESIKRELKTRPIYECRCDERLKTKAEESTRLAYLRSRCEGPEDFKSFSFFDAAT